MAKFWSVASSNAFNTTLNGNVAQGANSITLTSVTGLPTTGGIVVIDRINAGGTSTPSLREYVSYTGISSTTLTGVTKGIAGSSDQAHSSGAVVEEVFTVTHWLDLMTLLQNVFTSGGSLDTTKVADLTTAQTFTNKTLTSPTINTGTLSSPTVTGTPANTIVTVSGTTPTLNCATGNIFLLAPMTGNTTFAVSNCPVGGAFMVIVQQGSGTSYTTTWTGSGFTTLTWETAGATAPTQTTLTSGYTTYGFVCTASATFQGYLVGTN